MLFPLLTGAVVGVADRCRSTSATIATLAGGQYALHVLLAVLHPHPPVDAAPSGLTMFALHAVGDARRHRAAAATPTAPLAAVGSALRRVLPRRPFVPPADGPLRPLRWPPPPCVPRQLALAAVPTRRGPPVGC